MSLKHFNFLDMYGCSQGGMASVPPPLESCIVAQFLLKFSDASIQENSDILLCKMCAYL